MPRIVALILFSTVSMTALGQTAQEILEEVIERDIDRKSSVQNYIVNQCTMGVPMMLYYEKVERELDGETFGTFRLVTPDELSRRQNNGVSLTPEEMEMYATGLEDMGEVVSAEIDRSGFPMQSITPMDSYDEPWASPDPRVMTGSMAMFMRAAAAAERDRQINGNNTDTAPSSQQLGQLIDDAELVGTETVEGRPAFHIRADDINYSQTADTGEQFDVNAVSIWIDQDYYVPLKVRMDGIADVEGESREMFMEMLSLDYQQIGPLYESMRQVMSMGGVLTPEQEAQITDAQAQLAEARAQLNQLSGAQRDMLENMLGPQMEMMENLVNTGRIEVVTQIPRIRVNTGLPNQVEMASAMFDPSICGGTGSNFFSTVTGGAAAAPGATSTSVPGGGSATTTQGSASGSGQNPGGSAATREPDLAAAQACLEQKIEEAQANQPRRRGLGGLLGGVGRAISQIGNLDIAGLASGLFDPGASEEDIEERARELGLTDADIAECRASAQSPAAPTLDF